MRLGKTARIYARTYPGHRACTAWLRSGSPQPRPSVLMFEWGRSGSPAAVLPVIIVVVNDYFDVAFPSCGKRTSKYVTVGRPPRLPLLPSRDRHVSSKLRNLFFIVSSMLSSFADYREPIFDQECLPAVEPKCQVLVGRPADTSILCTIEPNGIDFNCRIANNSIQ